jgi:flagellin-specific chaperone FliS
MVSLKIKDLKIEERNLREMKKAIQIIDELRKRHKMKKGEITSEKIIRNLRDTRYSQ